jgi:hypothetical protein
MLWYCIVLYYIVLSSVFAFTAEIRSLAIVFHFTEGPFCDSTVPPDQAE